MFNFFYNFWYNFLKVYLKNQQCFCSLPSLLYQETAIILTSALLHPLHTVLIIVHYTFVTSPFFYCCYQWDRCQGYCNQITYVRSWLSYWGSCVSWVGFKIVCFVLQSLYLRRWCFIFCGCNCVTNIILTCLLFIIFLVSELHYWEKNNVSVYIYVVLRNVWREIYD